MPLVRGILTLQLLFLLGTLAEKEQLYIAGFLPFNESKSDNYESIASAANIALNHINSSPDILENYSLKILWNDSKCNPGIGLKAFFDMIHELPKKTFILGDTCSAVTDIIAKAARHWNLIQLSYADTHPMFTDEGYPHLFRIVPSENEYNPPRLSLLRYYNWTRVGTLYQNEAKYALAHNDLVSKLEGKSFEVVESQSFNDEITDQLDILKAKDIRIILGNFNATWARNIFCEAFKKNMYGRKFQWLIVGIYPQDWWLEGDQICPLEQLQRALVGTIVMEMTPLSTSEEPTVLNLTAQGYMEKYESRTDTKSSFHGYAFDGIYALAKALHEVDKFAPLRNFEYSNKTWQKWLIDRLHQTSFRGVTGPVRFKKNSRRGDIVMQQIQEVNGTIETVCIGEYSGVTNTLHLEKCNDIYWYKNRPPKDRTFSRIVPSRINSTVFISVVVVAVFGILLALTFLGVNIRFRHERQIKMSSPNMNNLIIIGCILTYISVILLGLDSNLTPKESFPFICTARAWILMCGFTLSFGSMFSKTWRVHSIFTNVQLNKKVMKDYQLYLVVLALVLIDIITMTTWQIVDPFYRETKQLLPMVSDDDEVQIIPKIEYCRSDHMTLFVGCIYAYKGVLMLFGAFLAWETRQVQIPALNDSKYVGISVYNVTIMCVLGVAVSFVLSEEQTASFLLVSIFIIFCNTGTLSLVFVPKIIDLKRDPSSKQKNGKATMKYNTGVAKYNNKPVQSIADMLGIAKRVNAKLRSSLIEIEKEISLASCLFDSRTGENANKPTSPSNKEKSQQSSSSTATSDYFSLASKANHSNNVSANPLRGPRRDDAKEMKAPQQRAQEIVQPPAVPEQAQYKSFQSYSHEELTCSSRSGWDKAEDELSDQMLPIFHRLLLDKQSKVDNAASVKRLKNASCPDISVKCDIVEYL